MGRPPRSDARWACRVATRALAWSRAAAPAAAASLRAGNGYVDFWGTVVREVLPAGRERPPEVFVEDGSVRVVASASAVCDAATAIARVRLHDGELRAVPMVRTSASEFTAETPAPIPGAYWAAVTIEDGSGGSITSGSGAVSSYEEEFAFREPDPTLGNDLSGITGGRLEPPVAALFDSAPALGRLEQPLWPILVLAGLLVFLLDVALRRLVFVEGDAEEWKRGMTSEARRERERVAEVEAMRETWAGLEPYVDAERYRKRLASNFRMANVFIIKAATDLPSGMYGAHSAVFLVDAGVPEPSGDRAHNTLIFADGRCIGTVCP